MYAPREIQEFLQNAFSCEVHLVKTSKTSQVWFSKTNLNRFAPIYNVFAPIYNICCANVNIYIIYGGAQRPAIFVGCKIGAKSVVNWRENVVNWRKNVVN